MKRLPNIGYSGSLALLVAIICLAAATFKLISSNPDVAELIRAIEIGDEDRATELIRLGLGNEVYHPLHEQEHWLRPIHIAALKGRHQILVLLMSQKDFDPNIRDYQGYTPLMYLCEGCEANRAHEYLKSVDELIHQRADVNASSVSGTTALHIASYPSFLTVALLAAGADPNKRDDQGNTPLHVACKGIRLGPNGSSADAIPSLLIAGADSGSLNNGGLTPIQIARMENRSDILRIFEWYERLVRKQREN